MDINKHINYIKNNCDAFVSDVKSYMDQENWLWFDVENIPTKEKIKKEFLNLLDDIKGNEFISCRGFSIFLNYDDNCIECYFGHNSDKKEGLSLKSIDDEHVYIVSSFGGQYDGKWDYLISVFTDYHKAIDVAKNECENHCVDESKLPMSFDDYRKFNYGYPDIPDEGYDTNNDELYDYYNTAIDRDGHTKEEFLIMEKMQELKYDDFVGCKIETRLLNSTDVENSSTVYIIKDINGKWKIN